MPEGSIERPLSPSLPRDCGHECKVCQVTVVSLTDYASHISNPSHKQNVEAAEQRNNGNDRDEVYFDRALVDLIEKRKEKIRKEEAAAAAAKRAQEEAEQKKQQRLKEAKERFRQDYSWRQPQRGCHSFNQPQRGCHSFNRQGAWYGNNVSDGRAGEAAAGPWNQGKSATWHAQEPPDFQNWASRDWAGGSLRSQEGWGYTQRDQGAFNGNQRGRLPWLSNGGSNYGVYGRNNIPQFPQQSRPLNLSGPSHPPPPTFFSRQVQHPGCGQREQQGDGGQHGDGPNADCDRNNSKTGSNQKLDKTCRFAPYPPTKLFESAPQKETQPSPSEKHPKVATPQKQGKAPDSSSLNGHSQLNCSAGGDDVKKNTHRGRKAGKKKNQDRSSSSSRSSSAQRDSQQTKQKAHQPSEDRDMKSSFISHQPSEDRDMKSSFISGLKSGAKLSKAPSQGHEQTKSASRQSGLLQSKQGQQSSEMRKKVKDTVIEKSSSLDISSDNRLEAALHIVEEHQQEHAESQEHQEEHAESQAGVSKENPCRQNGAEAALPDSIRPDPCGDEKVSPALAPPSSDSSQFLQSVQVSTSTMASSEPAASCREDEEEDRNREAMQAVEAGQGSESESSTAPTLSKLGLPALKRDLTKHISSKSKPGSYEPNLNSARRVRHLSETRRGESEKESGLKPTVRQLISSSASRRNVNWDQVYQEVRKKQGQGKGMPRFGIEMVSCDQEEEDDLRLLEGLQWEELIDAPAAPQVTPRKRCSSESSVAPDCSTSHHALFSSSQVSRETAHPEGLSWSGTQGPSTSAPGNRDSQRQQEDNRMLGQCEAQAQKQKQPAVKAVKALQRSDSALGDSSSGTELYDGQGAGKKRRAAGDVPSPEIPCLERKNKRRKIKPRRERLQVDQLLAVSLREEELSRTMQAVDSSLVQARATLEAAYREVQRLMLVKQQVTGEMTALRNKRIDLLKGIQGGLEDSPPPKVNEEKTTPSSHVTPSTPDAARCASPPSSTLSFMPVVIKQEPLSPVRVSTDPELHCAHSTTPDLHLSPVAASHPADLSPNCQSSPERRPELSQIQAKREATLESIAPAECTDTSSGAVQMIDKALQATRDTLIPLDIKPIIRHSSASRRSSDAGSPGDPTASSAPPALTTPLSPSQLRGGKRVRRLKKRRVLNKAQGAEQPETSDTEADGEASRPRWVRARRRASGGSQVSTSTPPTGVEDEECDRVMEGDREGLVDAVECKDMECSLDLAELSHVASAELGNTDTTEPEESMEVTTACQLPQMDGQAPSTSPSLSPARVPDSSRADPQSLAFNEVTSTSDMDVSPVVKPYESDLQIALALAKTSQTSDVSCDPGEDDMTTEGAFDMTTEGAFEGHKEAVNAMEIHKGLLYTCSGDRTVKAFNLLSRKCESVFEGHSSKVNCLLLSVGCGLVHRLYSGSSDQTIRCYSLMTKEFEQQFCLSERVLCLHKRWNVLYAGLANGTVVTFCLKTNKQLDLFNCHGPRGVSCLQTAMEGDRKLLLVGSYDSTISVRDASTGLLLRSLEGHTKTVLCMQVANDLIFSGSSDQSVHAHNFHTGELVRVYNGHQHAVTEVTIMGKMMVTACLDKLVRVYKLQSSEQLQVYGGHKDMVMCMVIHNNMIYTGGYDGSVQAVKLNLKHKYRCWWDDCSLTFGVLEHLQHHLISDHATTNLRTLKCHWKTCQFSCARKMSTYVLAMHMQKHAEEELKP